MSKLNGLTEIIYMWGYATIYYGGSVLQSAIQYASYRSKWFSFIDSQPPVWVVYILKSYYTRTMDMHPELSYMREREH